MAALYELAYTETALKYLETVIPPKIRGRIKRKVEILVTNPYASGCKKLHGVVNVDDPVYRIRSGDYRILYIVRSKPNQIIVLDIDNRKNIYR
jgi:mRNA interferase RelE/StbE